MKPTNDVVACVIDHGLYAHVAQGCARGMKQVFYWSESDTAFPKLEQGIIGDGLDNVERVLDFWDVKSQVDVFVFPDVGFAGLQMELLAQGYPVWGHHGADELEVNRGLFLRTIKSLGMDVPKYEEVTGLSDLRDHLRDREDVYIKVSRWRGDLETTHWRNWKQDEAILDCWAYKLGPAKELVKFYVLDPIDADIEDGIDTYCIDGQFPSMVMHGFEKKDKSYLCSVQSIDEISDKVKGVNDAFGPVLAKYGYRGAFSTEVRINGDKSYFIDPTCRFPSPPSQVMVEIFGNFADIIWHGANGDLIDLEPAASFGAQALITVDREPGEWEVWDIPKSIKRWVKPCFGCEINGSVCLPPSPMPHYGGWLVALGDTIEDVIESLKEYRKELPDGVECDVASLANLLSEAAKAEDEGIKITDDELPEPSIVIEDE